MLRVDSLLQALFSSEALPDGHCSKCAERVGKWRCNECFQRPLLCRACMRQTHMDNPFHRIEVWTGTHFRAAELWEVGVYIQVRHQNETHLCQYMQWQKVTLEGFQKVKDKQHDIFQSTTIPGKDKHDIDVHDELAKDAAYMSYLDQLYEGTSELENGADIVLEEDDEEGAEDAEADIMNGEVYANGFGHYMDRNQGEPQSGKGTYGPAQGPSQTLYPNGPVQTQTPHPNGMAQTVNPNGLLHTPHPDNPVQSPHPDGPAQTPHPDGPAQTPHSDALNNTYVRVIHTNGVHHLALVTCSCSGLNTLPEELIHSGFMPTSFKRVRTIFTLAVLDLFRYSNLEMKASAYQFFQMLRRVTMPMAPAQVVNFYHELRRLSHLWRWMKKLKWAGCGHKKGIGKSPDLGIFCPACLQAGINLPDDWMNDVNHWVYRHSFVADGNFKADHVRQKKAALDVWLLDGGGMMTKRDECNAFLRTATERSTVSVGK